MLQFSQSDVDAARKILAAEIADLEVRLDAKRHELLAFNSTIERIASAAVREAGMPTGGLVRRPECVSATFGTVPEAVLFCRGHISGEFSSVSIRDVLTKFAPDWISNRDPSAISGALARMSKPGGPIRLVAPGSGKRAAIYEWAPDVSETNATS